MVMLNYGKPPQQNQIELRIGGVPEHFNLPWHLALPGWRRAHPRAQVNWQDFPAGTGAMVQALLCKQLDFALLVSEGGVMAADQHAHIQLLGFYTRSPLRWGIHVPPDGSITDVQGIRGQRYAISRYGSGSQLLARIHAYAQGWPLAGMKFVVVNDIDGAARALGSGQAEVFFWEHYTTKPRVAAGQFLWLEDFPPPWPGFVIAARHGLNPVQLSLFQDLLAEVLAAAAGLKMDTAAPQLIAERYGMRKEDATDWLAQTEWAAELQLDADIISTIRADLHA